MKRTSLVLLLAVAGCDPSTPPADAGSDAPSVLDAPAALDAPAVLDVPADGSRLDAPASDVPSVDAALDDAGTTDVASDDAPSSCDVATIESAASGILFTSDSDYPLLVASFAGEGDAAPTAADVVRLAELPAGSATESQTVDWFFARLVEFPETTGDRVAALRALVEASWRDVTVVRVPDADVPVQIHVYLVGRDGCGNLLWLASTSVET